MGLLGGDGLEQLAKQKHGQVVRLFAEARVRGLRGVASEDSWVAQRDGCLLLGRVGASCWCGSEALWFKPFTPRRKVGVGILAR